MDNYNMDNFEEDPMKQIQDRKFIDRQIGSARCLAIEGEKTEANFLLESVTPLIVSGNHLDFSENVEEVRYLAR